MLFHFADWVEEILKTAFKINITEMLQKCTNNFLEKKIVKP